MAAFAVGQGVQPSMHIARGGCPSGAAAGCGQKRFERADVLDRNAGRGWGGEGGLNASVLVFN